MSSMACSSCGQVHDHTPWWKPGKLVGTHQQEKNNPSKKSK